ncbi:phosphoenolpyruvate--protein phosphotransferase [Psychrobacillus psychrodurans]|uniref:phosphoenolpyruvate--protein phosphotransferase n=1 Tax=Psychrobacillus psychrodurans TaxID=126157 RepID=UPI0008F18D79|nr:phosphoenolpyruvate--protein phosphotransferase [Psychrobacillus psychrodurans]MCZ8538798.1 phosphoenolpyruvate--protein phosphotransferase [Psychrobacillus psychrodurans]SFM22134.1 phosphotransferase system, enzyme I, PtsI [Psychrobacillus psychrodurans]
MTENLIGIAASSGIAIGKAFLMIEPDLTISKSTVSNKEEEVTRFHEAVNAAKLELQKIRDRAEIDLGAENAAIFDAHLLVLSDPELIGTVECKINDEAVNAEAALQETADTLVVMFEQLDNEYMRERAADIRDVTKRVIARLLGVEVPNVGLIDEEVIIISKDLAPSDTAQLNRAFAKGFTTDMGGRTSHSAIMARSLEIPAVVGTKNATSAIKQGDFIVVDGDNGEVIINPSKDVIESYVTKRNQQEVEKQELLLLKNKQTITLDGIHVEVAANIGTPKDIESVLENGGEGVGLYRTEFLYMERDSLPTEEEQFQAYKQVLEQMDDKPVVVRTLDIGGDKQLPYLNLPEEMNPFLGFRAIRLCLEEQTIFRTQLRALLRASNFGNLKIMFPMIATLEEFREAKQLLLEEKEKLQQEGTLVSDHIEVGIMVEIPSTAVLADQFAKEVDFFSVGTNDLIQYTMAADRMNESVAYLYQPYHPAILRLVKMVIDAAHANGKWAGMCGEMAGDSIAIPLLIGLGLDEFSMSAPSMLKARNQINQLTQMEMKQLADKALSMQTSEQVKRYVKETLGV